MSNNSSKDTADAADTTVIDNENHGKTSKTTYLHVGPSGDCWTGDSIFAAKHLQPDYVKSIPLPVAIIDGDGDGDGDMQQNIDNLMEVLEDDQELAASIYDSESIPSGLLDRNFGRATCPTKFYD
jgi:hypothetical protein